MIVIPEIETVVILVPRTGSSSLRHAVARAYPQSFMLYRHMEADGIPLGYDRWNVVGAVRHPVARLWSMYKFWERGTFKHPAYAERLQNTTRTWDFSDWLIKNETTHVGAHDSSGAGEFFPRSMAIHNLPENRKSQFVYLRPDRGTRVFRYENYGKPGGCLWEHLHLDYAGQDTRENVTDVRGINPLTAEAIKHVTRFFEWELEHCYNHDIYGNLRVDSGIGVYR